MRLQGKITVVTGAGSGLGKSIALECGKEGAQVLCVNRNTDNAQAVAQEIIAAGGNAYAFPCDISDSEQVQRLFASIEKKFNTVDILINNAGITGRAIGDGPVHLCKEEAWDTIMDTNMRGTFLCCKYGIDLMMRQKTKGVLVNMSSVLGLVGCQDHFTSHAYQTTKAGIIGMTRSIAAFYAKHGIRANTLAPGFFESRATDKVSQDEEIMRFMAQMQPLGALGDPHEVAKAAIYLASDDSSFVTGQVLTVDGGWTMQ